MFGKSSKLEILEELNKRKAYYTSQELGKRTNTIYYIQTLYILIYIVFIVEIYFRYNKIIICDKTFINN